MLGMGVFAAAASGQSWIERANGLYDDIVESRWSHPIILPALIELESPPVGVETPAKASMMFAEASGWAAAVAWAQKPSSMGVIDALERATQGDEYDTAMAFALPYGVDGIGIDLIRGEMYTDLGDPPLISGARHLYMKKFDTLRCLVHVEATRRLADGEVAPAMDLLVDLVQFGYQMADRETLTESAWGYRAMTDALSRIRDIAYQDFKGDRAVDLDAMKTVLDRLHPEDGPSRLDRLNLPRANRLGAEQLIEVLYQPKGGVDENRFVPTMVRLATSERPLRRFSAATKYETNQSSQQDWFDINDVLKGVFQSWEKRWTLDRFDPLLNVQFAWDSDMVGDDTLVVTVGASGDLGELFDLRTHTDLERVGTRQSVGLLGRFYRVGIFAPRIDAIRPRWIDRLEDDPLNQARAGGRRPPMRYFRPVTDDYVADKRKEKQPHTMQLFPGDGTNFEITLYDDQFLVYSTGEDGEDNNGTRMSVDPTSVVGDYLIWPPMLGLHREHLRYIGELE